MTTRRILHQIHLANNVWGGMEKQFASLLQATTRDARVEHYLSEDLRELAPGVVAALPLLSAPASDMRRWYGLTMPNWRGMRQSRQAMQARAWGVDTVLSWNRFGDPRPAQLAARLGAASVYWERGAAWFARSRAPDIDFLQGFDLYLANSHACAAMLRYWGVTGPIEICRPGVLAPAATQPRTAIAGRLRLGFCARLESFKGGVLAIHVLAALRRRGFEAELAIAGDGPDRAAMEAVASSLGLSDLRWHGRLTDTSAFYRDIDLLLHPALREPFGNACAEALVAGVPVVATGVDGLPELIRQGRDGLCVTPTLPLARYEQLGGRTGDVYPRVWRPELNRVAEPALPDPEQLADAVLHIAGDAARYAAFSAGALESAARRLDYGAHVGELLELLGRTGRRRAARPAPAPRAAAPAAAADAVRPAWRDRADKAAELIGALLVAQPRIARSVADLGCGDGKLRAALRRAGVACEYRGYDLQPQSAEIERLDLLQQPLPRRCGVAAMLGVAERLDPLAAVLDRLRGQAAALVISHPLPEAATEVAIAAAAAEFEAALADRGWTPQDSVVTADGRTRLWACLGPERPFAPRR